MALPTDAVLIAHPGLDGDDEARTTRGSYEGLWKDKGWRLVRELEVDGEPVDRDAPAPAKSAASKGDKA